METAYTEPRIQPESYPEPNEGQKVLPNISESEVDALESAEDSDVDLDKEKIKKYPKSIPPELY